MIFRIYSGLILFLFSVHMFAQSLESIGSSFTSPEFRQFDFWIGEWNVNLRTIQPDNTWTDSRQSTARIYRILDGKAILELWNENKVGEGIKGYSLRYFNEKNQKWDLWLNWPGKNRSGTSGLQGKFRHGRGEFFSEQSINDTTLLISRYAFCDISPASLRWDDAYSEDNGKTWTNNWIMEFSRSKEAAESFDFNNDILTYDSGNRCDMDEFRHFEQLTGHWSGTLSSAQNNRKIPIELKAYKILDGCAVITFMNYEVDTIKYKSFSLKTFNTSVNKYEEGILSNRQGGNFQIFYGEGNSQKISTILSNPKSHGIQDQKSEWTFQNGQVVWTLFDKKGTEWVESKRGVFHHEK